MRFFSDKNKDTIHVEQKIDKLIEELMEKYNDSEEYQTEYLERKLIKINQRIAIMNDDINVVKPLNKITIISNCVAMLAFLLTFIMTKRDIEIGDELCIEFIMGILFVSFVWYFADFIANIDTLKKNKYKFFNKYIIEKYVMENELRRREKNKHKIDRTKKIHDNIRR